MTQGLDKEPLVYAAGQKYRLRYLLTVYTADKSREFIAEARQFDGVDEAVGAGRGWLVPEVDCQVASSRWRKCVAETASPTVSQWMVMVVVGSRCQVR